MDKTKALEVFYKQFTTHKYKKGEILIRADDEPQGIFYLTKGYVRRYALSETGSELTLQIFKPISFFPMVWAINDTPNTYNFEAITPVEAGRAPKDKLINFVRDKPDILLGLMGELLEDYADTMFRVEQLVYSDAYKRIISILLYIAKNFGEEIKGGCIIRHRFTHQNIATMAGVARETASNEIEGLEKRGLVKYIKHYLFFDNIDKLRAELFLTRSKL